jgi:hypothetical protein
VFTVEEAHSYAVDPDEWRRLCERAFENLPSDTKVTMADVDAILTWCLPVEMIPGSPDA